MEKQNGQRHSVPRFLLAAPASGSGKTVITCGLLRAFQKKGLSMASFKCGPDYIDPLFHEHVIGVPSRNLDPFFCDADMLCQTLSKGAADAHLSILEGVMGYYDGLGGNSTDASTYDVARKTQTPVILVINGKGASVSLLAQIRGFLEFREDNGIAGIILNRITKGIYPLLKDMIEQALGIRVFGYVPVLADAQIESRHLGLMLPGEVSGLQEKLDAIADVLRESIDLEALQALADSAPEIVVPDSVNPVADESCPSAVICQPVRIAVARDDAFCFYYQDNLDLLEELGAELVPFSPLRDTVLPEGTRGLILGGGYPEVYAKELAENHAMKQAIRQAAGQVPVIAECGGFMYLLETLEGMDGTEYEMCGAIKGRAWRTRRLQRFGYITLTAKRDQMAGPAGSSVRGHEFHYYDTDCNGSAFLAEKPKGKPAYGEAAGTGGTEAGTRGTGSGTDGTETGQRGTMKKGRSWECINGGEMILAGFPHLYYRSAPEVAARFLAAAAGVMPQRKETLHEK